MLCTSSVPGKGGNTTYLRSNPAKEKGEKIESDQASRSNHQLKCQRACGWSGGKGGQ